MAIVQKLRAFFRSAASEANGELHAHLHRQIADTALQTERRLRDEIRYESGLVKELLLRQSSDLDLKRAAYRVYSQFGEDGILQYLTRTVPIAEKRFIEIGVEDYSQSNTRYLLQKDAWRGVVIDSAPDAEAFLKTSHLMNEREIEAVTAFVTAENVDELLRPYAGDVGILSLDIDGNDYHVWKALTCVEPRILVIEYQPIFGPTAKLTVPYRPDWKRTKAHFSNLYFGTSLAALVDLGHAKGYALVGASDGPNAFFVRRDLLGGLPEVSPEEAYHDVPYRESRDEAFDFTYVSGREAKRAAIADCPVLDLVTGEVLPIRDVAF